MAPHLSRRRLLASLAGGVAGTAGIATRERAVERYVVGTESPDARSAARSRVEEENHVLDFGAIGDAVTGTFAEADAEQLRDREEVRYVESGTTYRAFDRGRSGAVQDRQTLPWGIDRIDADVAHEAGVRGNGVHVAILDSGIRATHPDLRPNLGEGKAYVDCIASITPRCGVDPATGDVDCKLLVRRCRTPWGDDVPRGHGTHVAGTTAAVDDGSGVVGVAPEATLHSVKVVDSSTTAFDGDIAAGITYVADQGWDVINMSLGGLAPSPVVADACRYAHEQGVLLVAAVGNDGPRENTVSDPARLPTVIGVSATTRRDRLAPFSSRGPNVELAAPGADICSTLKGGQGFDSGTSMAAPHVAGVGALLMGEGLSNVDARDRLQETAEDLGLVHERQGHGLVDAAAALDLDSGDDGVGRGVCRPADDGSGGA